MTTTLAVRPVGDAALFEAGKEQGRLPPMDLEAEAAVISSVLLGGVSTLALVRDFLRPEHFYAEAHRRIYEAAIETSDSGVEVDTVTVGSWLRNADRLAQVGGMSYMTELLGAAPAVANVVAYARIIHDRWRERRVIETAQRIVARGYLGVENTQAFCDGAVRSLAAIARQSVLARQESNVDLIARILRDASERATSKVVPGFRTGIAAWDEDWGGVHPGEQTTIVALPKAGKTSLAIQLLENFTAQRIGVALFSQDSAREELFQDLITHKAKVDNVKFRKKPATLTNAEWSRITEASSEIARRTYVIDDERGITVRQIRARAVTLADEMPRRAGVPLGVVIVDYVQQLGSALDDPRAKKHEWVGHAARELKSLARELNVPVVVMAQQKSKDSRGAMVWAAADSSEIEKECDNRFFLVRLDKRRRRLKCDLIRRGEPRDIELSFDGPSRTFSDAKFEPPREYVDDGVAPPDSSPLPPDPDEKET